MNNLILKNLGKNFIKNAIKNKEIQIKGKVEYNNIQGTLAELNIKLDNSVIAGKLFISGQLEKDFLGDFYAKNKK